MKGLSKKREKEIRAELSKMEEFEYCGAHFSVSTVKELLDEIVDLRTELATEKQRNEELEMHNSEHGCGVAEVARERDKLKAALEEILREPPAGGWANYITLTEKYQEIARNALGSK